MGNNKDIGKIFREKLNELDKSPSDGFWSSIEKDLDSKKKRRFPLFWIFSPIIFGIISSGLLYWNVVRNQLEPNSKKASYNNTILKKSNNNIVNHTNEENANNQIVDAKTKKSVLNKNINSNNHDKIILNSNSNISSETNLKNNINIVKTSVSNNGKSEQEREKLISNKSAKPIKDNNNSKTSIVSDSKKSQRTVHTKNTYTYETTRLIKNSKRLVKSTEEYDEYEVVKKYTYIVKKKKIVEKKNVTFGTKNEIKKHKKIGKKRVVKNEKQSNSSVKKEIIVMIPIQNTETEHKNTLIVNAKTDSIIIPIVEKKIVFKNPKKEVKKPKDSIQIEENKKRTLFVSPYAGPSYYGIIGKGNSIATQYENETKKGLIDLNYGIYIRWMFDDKIGLRTGVGKTNISYATTIQKNGSDFLNTSNINLNSGLTTQSINNQFVNDSEVVLTQKISYYEVPLEVYYTFINKKIIFSTAFGLSYLILDNNKLLIKSNNIPEYSVGKVTNLIDQSMCGNVKLILSYKILKSLNIDVSPSIQYHFIGFRDVKDFGTYFASIQAGISYKL
jgi:hypothetical protein